MRIPPSKIALIVGLVLLVLAGRLWQASERDGWTLESIEPVVLAGTLSVTIWAACSTT